MKHLLLSIATAFLIVAPSQSAMSQWIATSGPNGYSVPAFAAIGKVFFAGTRGAGVFRTTDYGQNWDSAYSSLLDGQVTALGTGTDPSGNPTLLAGTYYAEIYKSTDSGKTWTAIKSPITNVISTFATSGTNIYIGTAGSGVYRSTNDGANWAALNPLANDTLYVNAIAFSGNYIFAAGTGMMRSNDNGKTWTNANNGLSNNQTFSLAVIGNKIIAGTNAGAFVSNDFGDNWTAIDPGLDQTTISALAVYGSDVFAGINTGILISTDSGATWNANDTGLTDPNINSLVVNNGFLYAGTYYGSATGVWKHALSDFAAVAENPTMKSSLTSYPNPFTNKTTINFTSTESALTEISVVNLLGQEVAPLFKGNLAMGPHSFNWNANKIPVGMYVAVIRQGAQVERIPMVRME